MRTFFLLLMLSLPLVTHGVGLGIEQLAGWLGLL